MKLTHIVFLILLIGAAVQAKGGSKKGQKGGSKKGLPLLQSSFVDEDAPQVDSMPATPQMKCILGINLAADFAMKGRLLTGHGSTPKPQGSTKGGSHHGSGATKQGGSHHGNGKANAPGQVKKQGGSHHASKAPKQKSNKSAKAPKAPKQKSNKSAKAPKAPKQKSNKSAKAPKQKSNKSAKAPKGKATAPGQVKKQKQTKSQKMNVPRNAIAPPQSPAAPVDLPPGLAKKAPKAPRAVAAPVYYTSVINNLMNYFPFLSDQTKAKLKTCNLDLSKAMARCEAVNGKGN